MMEEFLLKRIRPERVDQIRELTKSAAKRRSAGEFLIEGPHLVEAALQFGGDRVLEVLMTEAGRERNADLIRTANDRGIDSYAITEKISQKLSETEAPQGVFCTVRIGRKVAAALSDVVLVLDDVQDPGNVGTLIRSAAWFGVKDIFLTTGTADPFSPKVLRATQGAIFMVDVHKVAESLDTLKDLRSKGYRSVGTVLSDDAIALKEIASTKQAKTAIVLGNEARGLSSEIQQSCDVRAIIEQRGKGESLNVAVSGAIVMYELTSR